MEDDRDGVPTRVDRPGGEARQPASSAEDPVVGRESTAQRYLVDREIARGGMGRVVEAIDTVLGRTVALKEALVNDDETLRRFARETRITAKLEHPSIVPVYDAGTAPDGTKFYVMRKVSGKPLDVVVEAATSLDERLALVPNVLAAAQAIAHAHQRAILHRDVKPPNILIGALGETIVIDWGLAKELDEQDEDDLRARTASQSLMTRYGAIVGTPGFMPPEQVRGEPVDERGDVFALGATLYYVLSGKPPFRGKTGDDVLRDTLERAAKPLHEAVPGIPAELATITNKALAVAAEDRYRDAGMFAQDLQRFLAGQLVASHDYTAVERTLRFVRRHRVAVAVVASAVVILSVGGGLAVDRILDARDAASAEAANAKRERAEADVARTQANDRADELALDKARLSITTDPTTAVAQIKRLASSPVYWREVRDIAAAARAAGVAWEMPAPKAEKVSVSGEIAVTSGPDGVIRRFDLRARTTTVLAELGKPAYVVITADGRRVAGYAGTSIVRIDLATGARSDVVVGQRPSAMTVIPGAVVWADSKQLFVLRDGTSVPEPIELGEPTGMGMLWLSPDGRWLGTSTLAGVHLIDVATLRRFRIPCAYCFPQRWPDDQHLELYSSERGKAVTTTIGLTDPPTQVSRVEGTTFASRGDVTVRKHGLHVHPFDGRRARGGAILEAGKNTVAVTSPAGDAALQTPTKIVDVASATDSPFVVALTDQRLWIWNLDDILPRALPAGRFAFFAGPSSVMTQTPPRWLNLHTGEVTEIPELATLNAAPTFQVAFPDVAMLDFDDHEHRKIFYRGKPARDIPMRSYRGIDLLDPDHVVFGRDGTVFNFDVTTQRKEALHVREDAGLESISADDRWIFAFYEDNQIWRFDRTTHREATRFLLPKLVGPRVYRSDEPTTHALEQGTVFALEGSVLRAWRSDDTVVELTMPYPIVRIEPLDDALAVVAFADRPSVVAIVADPPRIISSPVRDPAIALSIAPRISTETSTKIQLTDELTGISWVLGRATRPYTHVTISEDERYVMAHLELAGNHTPVIWSIAVPATPAATAAWLDRMTNVPATRR